MPERIHDSFFLFGRADRHSVLRRLDPMSIPLRQPNLVLYLGYIQSGHLESVLLFDVVPDLRICCGSWLSFQFFNVQIYVDIAIDLFPT